MSPKESTTPIPLAHVSNSSDDSKEAGPSNSLEAVDDYYKMLLKECAKDCKYFDKEIDSTPQSVKETNEEVASQSGGESNETMTPILAILKKRCQMIRMILMMMDIMDTVDIMNMINVIEVITIMTEDTKGKPHQ